MVIDDFADFLAEISVTLVSPIRFLYSEPHKLRINRLLATYGIIMTN